MSGKNLELHYTIQKKALNPARQIEILNTPESEDKTFEYYFREVMGPGW